MANHPLASYALALLNSMGRQEDLIPLGNARLVGSQTSTFDVPAHRILQALLEHSPSPETMAQEFLAELTKCQVLAVNDSVNALGSDRTLGPDDWALSVHQELRKGAGNLTHLTALASHYLSHLIIPFRNPGGKKTPQDSIDPTPNLKRMEEIRALLQSATVDRSQAALRDLVFLRDGNRCPVSRHPFIGDGRVVKPRCAHIIPFSVHGKGEIHRAIETFTGQTVRTEFVVESINHPANAMNIENNARESIHDLAWGIEARLVDSTWKYYFRVVRPKKVASTIPLDDGDEIEFGRGDGGDEIALPDPRICNLHLAVARVFAASGAAEVFDKYLDEDDCDLTGIPVYFGGPFVDDDVLMRKLEVAGF